MCDPGFIVSSAIYEAELKGSNKEIFIEPVVVKKSILQRFYELLFTLTKNEYFLYKRDTCEKARMV